MKKLFLLLLLIATQAGAQDVSLGQRPAGSSGGASFSGGTITAPILAPSGSAAAPPYSFSTETNLGIFRSGAGLLGFASGGFEIMRMSAASFFVTAETRLGSANQFTWSSNAVAQNAAADTGLARSAAGVVRLTDGGAGYASLVVAAGTASLPSISFNGHPATGWYETGTNAVGFTRNTSLLFAIGHASATDITLKSDTTLGWSAGAATAASDTGLARNAAGVVRVTNGSSGIGQLLARSRVVAVTGVAFLSATDSGSVFTNEGDTDGSSVGLANDPAYGIAVTVTAVVAQEITITAGAGETLYFGNTACGTSLVVGGAATGIGDSVTIVAATSGSGAVWITTASAGTPVCTP